jgi:phosphatidylserine/phosphatidylglycerophosphate/cardiolipin synthase-like enzyme
MKKLILLICFLALITEINAQVVTIASIKQNNSNGVPIDTGQIKTITGIITVANELGGPSYMQDNTAGIAVFYNDFSQAVKIGDSVVVRAKLTQFNGLTELIYFNTGSDSSSFSIVDSNKTVIPVVITLQQFTTQTWNGFEEYEGKLIRVNNVSFTATGTFSGGTSGFNYNLTQGSTTYNSVLRIDNNVNIVGTVIPTTPVDIIGAGSQFKSSPPYDNGYQFFPRFVSDIIQPGPSFATNPVESNIAPTSITLSWTTVSPGNTRVRFFRSDSLAQPVVFSDSVVNAAQTTNHTVNLSNLTPGKIYFAEVTSSNSSGTSTFIKYFSTASDASSTGKMEVYFNRSVDHSFAMPGNNANGDVDLRFRLRQRIDSAQYSIDLCLYSFNESYLNSVKESIISAIIRGVKIRMVYDSRPNQALVQELITSGVRVQKRPEGSGLMHNKFIIFDARNDNSFSDDWLWTGSANLTANQVSTDAQNVIFVQDQALCGTYTREFEEMWGSHNDINDPSQAKFGEFKLDNTPHIFNINGKHVECYFSPGDDVSSKIENLINTETHKSINFCIFAFTRFQISNRMKTQFNQGKLIRGVFDRSTNTNSTNGPIYAEMTGGGSFPWNPPAPVFLSLSSSWQLHHKYMLIDPDMPSSNPVVQTGSFNYSNAGNFSNDENVIFVFDSLVTNQYFQEFAARYIESGGTIGIQQISSEVPMEYSLSQNYPNPFNPTTNINFSLPTTQYTILKVFDILGKEVSILVNENLQAGEYNYQFSTDDYNLSSGVYFYTLQSESFVMTKKMLLIK